jgi:transposase
MMGTIGEAVKPDRIDEVSTTMAAQRRRFWSAEEKRKIVAEAMAPGASMAEVARLHDLNPNLLFTWRRKARGEQEAKGSGAVELVPVVVTPETASSASRLEIVLVSGERILVGADVDAGALARIVRALSRR